MFWVGLGAWSTYNLLDAGLSRFLALETLTHGTGPGGYIGINLRGGDPQCGGGEKSASFVYHPGLAQRSINYFHVFKDSEFQGDKKEVIMPAILNLCGNYLLPKAHAILAGVAMFNISPRLQLLTMPVGGAVGLFTPTLKFRFTPEEVENLKNSEQFENDEDSVNLAYKTKKPISPWRLGITGSLVAGLNSKMFKRMIQRPLKVAFGALLLALAAYTAKTTLHQYEALPASANSSGTFLTISKAFFQIFLNTF